MDHLHRTLSRFGLSENEIKIYLEALKLEETSPFELSRLTGIPRTSVYDILMTLSLKGLVTLNQSDGFTKQQTKIKAKNPSELRRIIRQKQHDLASLELDIVDILPDLKQTFQPQEANTNCRFYPGIEGAKKVYFAEHQSDINLPICAFENLMSMDAFGHQPVNREVSLSTQRHLAQSPQIREIVPLTDWAKHVLTYQYGRDPNYITARQIRYVDNPIFDLHQRLTIQGNRVCISCAKNDEAWGMVINSLSLAATLRSIFELVWQFAQPVTPEFIQSLGPNQFLEAEINTKVLK